MRILGACIFSKFFGGKIKDFYMHLHRVIIFVKKKKRRMRILSARIFSKSFGGKINFFLKGLP